MALVPILGLVAVVLNLAVSRFFTERQEAISSLYLVISYVNVLVGIVAFLHTGTCTIIVRIQFIIESTILAVSFVGHSLKEKGRISI